MVRKAIQGTLVTPPADESEKPGKEDAFRVINVPGDAGDGAGAGGKPNTEDVFECTSSDSLIQPSSPRDLRRYCCPNHPPRAYLFWRVPGRR